MSLLADSSGDSEQTFSIQGRMTLFGHESAAGKRRREARVRSSHAVGADSEKENI